MQSYKQQGKIKTTEAQLLTAAVNHDYKDEKLTIDLAKKEKREAARLIKESEWEQAEKEMEEQRKRREESRQAVQSHLDSLSKDALHDKKLAFIADLGLKPDQTLPEIESTHREPFFDWIAEQTNL